MASTYHLSIQDEFTRLRGTPFLLAATDFEIAEKWRQAGVPLEVVLDSMRTVLEGRDPDRRRARGLKIIDRAVWRSWRTLGGTTSTEVEPNTDRISSLASAVRTAGLSGGDRIAHEIEATSGTVEEQEQRLAELDRQLVCAAGEELGERWLANQRRRAEAEMAALRPRLAEDQWRAACASWVEESARELLRLPRLSLFG